MAQIEYVGEGALQRFGDILESIKPKKVFLVVGESSFSASGAERYFAQALKDVSVTRFNGLAALPTQADVDRGIELYKQTEPDLVVAVGGGHVMDVAKAINFLNDRKPLVAIPTTAGSGAEATPFAVVYKDGVKTSLEDPGVLPTYTIVDPALGRSVPRSVALASGLDALTQAVESYWARGATEESKKYAAEALKLVWPALERAVDGDQAARAVMMEGAHLAGKAIAISKTTACHALSYGLTAKFSVPHGIAVAVFLPEMMRLNNVAMPLPEITAEATEALLEKFGTLKVSSYGVAPKDISVLAAGVDPARLGNNPKVLSPEDITHLYTEIL